MSSHEILDRFWNKVDCSGGEDACWTWTAYHGGRYGTFGIRHGTTIYAHRFAYLTEHGAIADGLSVLHGCDNPQCCNPAHLFLGTQADNMRDKAAKGRNVNPMTDALAKRTHCPKGHALTPDNIVWRRTKTRCGRSRQCRICHNAQSSRNARIARERRRMTS